MRRQCIDKYDGPTTLGCDVSKYQGLIDWDTVVRKSPCRFVFVRTGDGRDVDSAAVRNIKGAYAVGLAVGTYHYFRADRGGSAQAALAARTVLADAGVDPLLPPVLDLESGASKDLPGGIADVPGADLPLERVADEAIRMLEDYERLFGMRPIVYTGAAMHWWYSQARPAQAEAGSGSRLAEWASHLAAWGLRQAGWALRLAAWDSEEESQGYLRCRKPFSIDWSPRTHRVRRGCRFPPARSPLPG